VDCIHTAEDILKLLSRPCSPSFLFYYPKRGTQFQGDTPSAGTLNKRVRKFCDFRLKSRFILETVRDRPLVAMILSDPNPGFMVRRMYRKLVPCHIGRPTRILTIAASTVSTCRENVSVHTYVLGTKLLQLNFIIFFSALYCATQICIARTYCLSVCVVAGWVSVTAGIVSK